MISPTGLILTNAHVASPKTVGVPEDEPDALGIALLTNEDEPPVPSFSLQLWPSMVISIWQFCRIDQNLDGSAIRPTDLALPYVAMGNSDDLHLGDNVYIFGFPGIGGDTITFTRHNRRLFQPGSDWQSRLDQDRCDNRRRQLGGLAVSDAGSIVGVPTRHHPAQMVRLPIVVLYKIPMATDLWMIVITAFPLVVLSMRARSASPKR